MFQVFIRPLPTVLTVRLVNGRMREWLKRQPWKGCGVVRLPRVRIPLLPPMCDQCLKRAIGREIIDIESKLTRVFKKIEANPESYKHDPEFIRLANTMAELLEKCEDIK